MGDAQKYAADLAQWQVKSGFWTLDELIDRTEQVLQDNGNITAEDAKTQAVQIVAPLWHQQLAAERSWPKDQKTIAEKFAAAFDTLHKDHKIPARMNFTCCRTCGVSEIGIGLEEGEKPVGYAFFHEQTTESFVQYPGSSIMIYYGTWKGSALTSEDVGKIVVQVLTEAGLSVDWDGNGNKAIEVDCEEWRKRLIEEESDLYY
ncbi:hypothetical protein GX51_02895 [Blastomyces parvus]|uniref:DUF6891 domain-containing protein n=1 Tax=Blastomyces parvus TaxID=2060905 RepID=A0A2B7X902_9EURO|nr:hypothetical protein GX51_02895 [Blastomyces parvus]